MSAEFPTLAEVMAGHADWVSEGVRLCSCFWTDGSPDAQSSRLIWAKHVESEWREACTIRTATQLDALPVGAVVLAVWAAELTPTPVLSRYIDGWFGFPCLQPMHPLGSGRNSETALLIWHPEWARP